MVSRWLTALPLLFALLGLPMALGRIAPNPVYGVRTTATLASDVSWYSANTAAGIAMAVGGIVGFVVNVAIVRSNLDVAAKNRYQLAVVIAIAVLIVIAGLAAD